MAKANRTCFACGKEYYYCPSCDNTGETWQIMFDCEDCQKAFMIASDYNFKNIDASIAKDRLLEIPNFKIENYRESIQQVAKEVLNVVPSDENIEVMEQPIEEVKEIEEEVKETVQPVAKTVRKKSRSKR